MELWEKCWGIIEQLRGAFKHKRAYLWFCTCLVAMMIRVDLAGVTSFIRVLGLKEHCYDRMLDFFHSRAVDIELLAKLWTQCVLKFGIAHKVNGRILVIGDGTKAPKEGKKMPAVKSLHQESESNSKPEYIMGHSCQALALCVNALSGFFAIPLIARIHEGIKQPEEQKKLTLLDKMALMLGSLGISDPFYFLGDSYYACRKMIASMIKNNNHIITRARSNSVAYKPFEVVKNKKRGRPKKYGEKVSLRKLFDDSSLFTDLTCSTDPNTLKVHTVDLIWKSVGFLVRFVLVSHPIFGKTIYLSSDLSLTAKQIIETYSLRFRIEITFRQAIHTIGTFAYHFWMREMTPIKKGDGDQSLTEKSNRYKKMVKRKINAYNLHIQLGIVAQGILQFISVSAPALVWSSFHSWIRTIRPNISPSEAVTATALRNSFPNFLATSTINKNFSLFIADNNNPDILTLSKLTNYG